MQRPLSLNFMWNKNVHAVSKPIVSAYLAINEPEHLTATRAIIVFGKNSATYKFALLKTLMDQPATAELKYEDIGVPFLTHLLEHHRTCPHQFNRSSTQLAKAMDDHIAGDMGWDNLFAIAERNIYNNVFDALPTFISPSPNSVFSSINYVAFPEIYLPQTKDVSRC